MGKFLTLSKAKKLLSLQLQLLPISYTDEQMSEYIEIVEQKLVEWLRRDPSLNLYELIKMTNNYGKLVLTSTPVQKIVKVEQIGYSLVDNQIGDRLIVNPFEEGYQDFEYYPTVSNRNSRNTIQTSCSKTYTRVIYWAGYTEIPAQITNAVFNGLYESLTTGSTIFFDQPFRQLTNQSLPGGLSQSFTYSSIKQNTTFCDVLFAGAKQYRLMFS